MSALPIRERAIVLLPAPAFPRRMSLILLKANEDLYRIFRPNPIIDCTSALADEDVDFHASTKGANWTHRQYFSKLTSGS
jgi:hypothetical protein